MREREDGTAAADTTANEERRLEAGSQAAEINLSWLLRLRWGAATGQLATIWIASRGLAVDLPFLPLHALVAVELATNLACVLGRRRGHPASEQLIGGLMALDVVLLTGLFHFAGGASNPFSSLYLVHIALAAVVLPAAWTWSLVALSLACFAALFLEPLDPGSAGGHVHGSGIGSDLRLHLEGMWVAFGVGATFIVYFVQRVTRSLADRERELAEARGAQARAQRLASLATLAAGAAHELSTPLSTIAVVAKELERQLVRSSGGEASLADVRLIRDELERCREILVQMAADAGEATGEDFVPVSVEDLLRAALAELPGAERVRLALADRARAADLMLPLRATAQALRALLKNAIQASPADRAIELRASRDGGRWRIEIRDHGTGMSPEVLARAFEPFFTTRATGRGMGLGLFLARDVVERVGGRLDLRSREAAGTTAILCLPAGPTLREGAPARASARATA